MRFDFGIRPPSNVEMNDGVERDADGDDARDDTTGSEHPVTLHSNTVTDDAASKPLFRTTSPKVEYAASSPYYDVLLYSFTPEQTQKQRTLSTRTTSRISKPTTSSSVDKTVEVNSKKEVREGTTVPIQDHHDKIGNGDQSPIDDPYLHQVYLDLFRTGGDFDAHIHKSSNHQNRRTIHSNSTSNHPTFSVFAEHCVSGRYEKVKHILEKNSVRKGKRWNVMIELLETRETILRLSPLLLVFCMLHKIGVVMMNQTNTLSNADTKSKKNIGTAAEPWMKYIDQLEHNLVKVVAELLRYGASPVAKDVCGRTVCFYGASRYATPRSLNAVTMCSNAAMTAHYFGTEVILHGFDRSTPTIECDKQAVCNGMRGLAGGYQVNTGQRIVYLFGRQSEVAISHRNIRLVHASDHVYESILNLCNVQDRLGQVCLTELCSSNRIDVIKYLLDKHQVSIDVEDWTGKSIRQRSFAMTTTTKNCEMGGDEMATAQIIVAHALKCGRQEQKRIDSTCTSCSKVSNSNNECNSLQFCQRCMSVKYCSEKCQADHWTNGGHRKECTRLRKLYNERIAIEESSTTGRLRSGNDPSFEKPSHVAFKEVFTIKVVHIDQTHDTSLLHIYDKSGECDFFVDLNETAGSTNCIKLLEKVKAESLTAGTAIYLTASFDEKRICSIYINRRKVRMW